MLNYVFIISAALVAFTIGQNSGGGPFIWDLEAVPLNAAEMTEMLRQAVPGETFPAFNMPPNTTFNCTQTKQPGYYADPEAGCQVIRRCTLNGGMVSYLCPNYTLFNQLSLVCDWWFNVDCSKAKSFYDFANPRIYNQKAKLHDTPPKGYIAPYFKKIQAQQRVMLADMQKQLKNMEMQQKAQLQHNMKMMGQQGGADMMMGQNEQGGMQQGGEGGSGESGSGMMMGQSGQSEMQQSGDQAQGGQMMGQEGGAGTTMMSGQSGESAMHQQGGEQQQMQGSDNSGQQGGGEPMMMDAQQQNDAPASGGAKGMKKMAKKSKSGGAASQKMMMSNMAEEKKKKKRALH